MVIGHERGSCKSPSAPIEDFTVVDLSGIHVLSMSFCDCVRALINTYNFCRLDGCQRLWIDLVVPSHLMYWIRSILLPSKESYQLLISIMRWSTRQIMQVFGRPRYCPVIKIAGHIIDELFVG